MASGFPDSVPAWYTPPSGRQVRHHLGRRRRTRRPAARRRSPCRSTTGRACTPDHAVAPPCSTRKPVMTSSNSSSAPTRSHSARSPARKPGAGRDEAHVGRHRLDDDHRDVVVERRARRCRAPRRCRPPRRRSRRPSRPGPASATPLPAGGQQGVGVAVVVAGELHQLRPAGAPRARRMADMAASVPDDTSRTCSTPGTRSHDHLGQHDLALGRRAEGGAVPARRRRTASMTAGWAWPRIDAP